MSDLISRSELISIIEREYREYGDDYDIEQILGDIEDMPTAFDVDKVVYEFESFAKLAEDRWTNGASEHAYQEHKCWVKAIEIVKQEAEQYQSSEIGFISKTEVLTLIEEIKCNDDIPKNYGTLLDIMRMIRNMPTVDNTDNGWIPCSERLPEESGYYLVTYHDWSDGNFLPKYNDTYVRRLHYQISEHFVGWNYPKNVDDRAENDCHKEVIAWQLLPEPYKERD